MSTRFARATLHLEKMLRWFGCRSRSLFMGRRFAGLELDVWGYVIVTIYFQ